MRNRIALTALVVFGLVVAFAQARALAQVANPWDPLAASNLEPKKSGTSKPVPGGAARVPDGQGGGGALHGDGAVRGAGDQRPLLRSMDGPVPTGGDNRDARTPGVGTSGDVTRGGEVGGGAPSAGQTFGGGGVGGVERSELAPVKATDGSNLPYELWRGLDIAGVEHLLAKIDIPPRSQALHALWVRLITSQATISNDPLIDQKFAALRQQALYRSGLVEGGGAGAGAGGSVAADAGASPVVAVLRARADIVLGDAHRGCEGVRRIDVNAVPETLKFQTILLFGYCAAAGGNKAAAEMAGDLAREHGLGDKLALAALDAVAHGTAVDLAGKGRITGLTYRLLQKANQQPGAQIVARAEPALLVALVRDAQLPMDMRLRAGEAGARINAITPKELAEVYRQAGRAGGKPGERQSSSWPVQQASAAQTDDPMVRAVMFAKLENEFTPFKKARAVRSFLDNARRSGLYLQGLQMVHGATDTLHPVPEISWFSETAIEIALASQDFARARLWAGLSSRLDKRSTGNLDHWLALIDIADPDQRTPRGANLKSVENMALTGRFGSEQLHRLATVLDALEYNVPIPLWQAASRTPQPSGGHLPETGVLTRLQDAAKNREFGRLVLLTMQTLGANGSEGAHMIALGDAIRALKRAGFERDARRLGFEALFAIWPRATSG